MTTHDVPTRRLDRLKTCVAVCTDQPDPDYNWFWPAITPIYPTQPKGKLNGHAVRVPLLNASITDCVFEMERETTAKRSVQAAAEGPLKGTLVMKPAPLVSDYTQRSAQQHH
jgi:glyceraldehyde-3-phosphate dehydrogenase/erythrose-4-phosphate dehydrogenase